MSNEPRTDVMSMSQRELRKAGTERVLDFDRLSAAVQNAAPDAVFAVVLGSGGGGRLGPGSDLDVALYLANPARRRAAPGGPRAPRSTFHIPRLTHPPLSESLLLAP